MMTRSTRTILILFFAFVIGPTQSARSQVLSSEAWRGAALGGVIGGIIGHNRGRRLMEGVGIGAVTGGVLGSLGHRREHHDTYIPSRSRSRYADAPHGLNRPHHAVTGAAVGAVAGGIIGHNSGRHTLEGVGIGAASGMAIGALVEHSQRRRANRHYFAEEAPPRHSIRFHANPPAAKPTAYPQPIRTRELREGSIVTTTSPALETSSTLIRTIPDRTDRKPRKRRPAKKTVTFEYLGPGPKK